MDRKRDNQRLKEICLAIGAVSMLVAMALPAFAAKPTTGVTEVTDIDNPARQPAQAYQTLVFPAGAAVHRHIVFEVPLGKRFVLEHISVNYLTTDTTISTRAIIEVSGLPGQCPQDPKMRHVLQVPEPTVISTTYANFIVSQAIKLYAGPEEHLCVSLNRSGDLVDRDVGVHLSGYYVNMPRTQ